MHFKDLEPCDYHHGPLDSANWEVPFLAVGWLEHPYSFAIGTPPPAEFVDRLAQLIRQTREYFPHYRFRGVHECSLCAATGRTFSRDVGWSQENLIVPGLDEVYVSPGGVVHYISDHSYSPPARFIAAVMACPDCSSPEYIDALRRANAGREPPLQTRQAFQRELNLKAEAALKLRDRTK